MIGGFNTGWEIISSHLSMTIYTFIIAFEIPSMLLCFIFRHNAAEKINQGPPSKMYLEKFFIVLTHLFPFATATAMWKSNLTQEQKYRFVKENWPQCLHWMKLEAFEVYDYKLNPWLAVVGIGAILFVVIVYSYGFTLGIHTMSILQKSRKSMSKQTFKMHRTALFSLLMQLLIPGMVLVGPLLICMTVVITGAIGLQELATDTMFLVGSHSMLSSTVMILTNPRYRKVIRESTCIGRLKTTNPSATVEPSKRSIVLLK
uniref:Serpentine Receptor, class H n=1 Tax=Caenorhabditis tropicalis TaxID=1561998 RepID=A0A1I7UGZ3_9PELO